MPSWHEKILLIEFGVPLDGELTEMTSMHFMDSAIIVGVQDRFTAS
jgi:hypothetical protein